MSGIDDDLEYFKGVIANPEADCLPLPDAEAREGESHEAVLRRALPDGLAGALASFAAQKGLDLTALCEAAAMLLLARYAGGPDALLTLVRAGKRFPVYVSFEGQASLSACCRAVCAQATEAARRDAGFDALCAQLGLPAMPVLTDDGALLTPFCLRPKARFACCWTRRRALSAPSTTPRAGKRMRSAACWNR